jgi:hypothetical protein
VVEEADETLYWLALVDASGLSDGDGLAALEREATELWAIFTRSQITAKTRTATHYPHRPR